MGAVTSLEAAGLDAIALTSTRERGARARFPRALSARLGAALKITRATKEHAHACRTAKASVPAQRATITAATGADIRRITVTTARTSSTNTDASATWKQINARRHNRSVYITNRHQQDCAAPSATLTTTAGNSRTASATKEHAHANTLVARRPSAGQGQAIRTVIWIFMGCASRTPLQAAARTCGR